MKEKWMAKLPTTPESESVMFVFFKDLIFLLKCIYITF